MTSNATYRHVQASEDRGLPLGRKQTADSLTELKTSPSLPRR